MSDPLSLRFGRHFPAGNVLFRGEFLGEMAILNGKPRAATAVVLESARCLVGRLRIAAEDPGGSIVVLDAPRLLEFMEFLEMPRKFEA